MHTEFMNQQHWRFLLGDLRAAEWVVRINPNLDAETLGKKFLSIHQYFLKNIGRERPNLFKGIDRHFLVTVVRKWIDLYRHTLGALAERYPNTRTSNELNLADVNWSRGLHISYEGILEGMSYASRYAEFWAEMSLRSEACFHSFEERKQFIGSDAYWHLLELGNAKKLTVVDRLENSATSFDMIRSIARAPNGTSLRQIFADEGWAVLALTPEAQVELRGYASEGIGLMVERPQSCAS